MAPRSAEFSISRILRNISTQAKWLWRVCVCFNFLKPNQMHDYLDCYCHQLKAKQGTITCTMYQFSSAAQSCPALCKPMDCSTPVFPVHHQLSEPTQTHGHWVSPTIQPSHPLSSPSLPTFSLFQHQGLFQWVFTSGGQSIGVSASASVLPMNIRGWFPLGLTGLISLQAKGLSRVFSNTTVQKHQFFSTQLSL